MEQLSVYIKGRESGTMEAEEQGLYMRFRAVCAAETDGRIPRLWAVGETGETLLGVLEPDHGLLRTERSLAKRTLGIGRLLRGEVRFEREKAAEDGSEEPAGWEVWRSGPAGGLRRREGERTLLAVPWEDGEACPLAPMFCVCALVALDGIPYLAATLPEDAEILVDEDASPALK